MTATAGGSSPSAARLYKAGINFRWVRSPVAPKMTIAHGCGTARVLKPSRSGFVCSVPFVTWSEDGKSNYGRARKESRSGSLRTADYLSRRLGFRLVEPTARREAAAAWRPNSAAEIFG